jgi:diketogulonate reductase-like aldo/keto reductase
LITNIAHSQKSTNAQVVYRFAQQLGIVPLAGSTNEQHMKDGVESDRVDLHAHLDELKGLVGY